MLGEIKVQTVWLKRLQESSHGPGEAGSGGSPPVPATQAFAEITGKQRNTLHIDFLCFARVVAQLEVMEIPLT